MLAVALREVDFGAEAEAFFRNENSGEVFVFFQNAKSFVICEFVENFTFGKAFIVEFVIDFTGWAENSDEKSNCT